jgi:hypothetical protein
MATTNYATTAALSTQSESPIMLPTAVPATFMWRPVVVVPKAGVLAASKSAPLTSAHITVSAVEGDPRSRQAKHAAPPRGRFR